MMIKTISTTLAALSVFAYGGVARAAESQLGFYIAYSPGVFVQYLSVNETGRDVSGYLEAIRATPGAAAGVTRTQTFGKRNGSALFFGPFTATKTANGFTLTAMTPEGRVVQESFARTSVAAINASIAALSSSVDRSRAQFAQSNLKADTRTSDASSTDDSAQLAKAQAAADSANAQLVAAQTVADHLSALARQARADANAAIDKPGVSLAQNQGRINAMKIADDAEQSLVSAQRNVNGAQNYVMTAKAEVLRLRLRIAQSNDRTHATGHLATNDAVGP